MIRAAGICQTSRLNCPHTCLNNLKTFHGAHDELPTHVRITPKLGRNAPCHCGSGKKYKHCCLAKDELTEREARAKSH